MVNKMPLHVGIIPDGNRRFAKRLMKQPWRGHEWGVGKFRSVLEWCSEAGIKTITMYALSMENIKKRPKREINYIYSLAMREIKDMLGFGSFVFKNRVKVRFFGFLGMLPEELREKMAELSEKTEKFSGYFLNIGIAYGGRQEILDACRSIACEAALHKLNPENLDESMFKKYLQTNGCQDPDLIIRTGGEKRISNFLLFQSAYSELAFIDSFWPELTKRQFFSAISSFSRRERRMGK